MALKQIDVNELDFNPFEKFTGEWALITAGPADNCNTMTISWGMAGPIWGVPSVTTYVRESRYTKQFIDREELFTLTFFGGEKKDALGICGKMSGRDGNKIEAAGLTPVTIDGTTTFEGATLVLVCRKMFSAPLEVENFAYDKPRAWYADGDIHTMYVGKIEAAYVAE